MGPKTLAKGAAVFFAGKAAAAWMLETASEEERANLLRNCAGLSIAAAAFWYFS